MNWISGAKCCHPSTIYSFRPDNQSQTKTHTHIAINWNEHVKHSGCQCALMYAEMNGYNVGGNVHARNLNMNESDREEKKREKLREYAE